MFVYQAQTFEGEFLGWNTIHQYRPSSPVDKTIRNCHCDIKGLNAVTDEHGSVVLQSGIEFTLHAYRGQPAEHVPCLPHWGG